MKDKRKIEILEIMLERLNDEKYAKGFKILEEGLCTTTEILKLEGIISSFEESEIDEFIMNSTSYRYDDWIGYIYKPGSINPRIKLLNRLIKQLKNN